MTSLGSIETNTALCFVALHGSHNYSFYCLKNSNMQCSDSNCQRGSNWHSAVRHMSEWAVSPASSGCQFSPSVWPHNPATRFRPPSAQARDSQSINAFLYLPLALFCLRSSRSTRSLPTDSFSRCVPQIRYLSVDNNLQEISRCTGSLKYFSFLICS